MSSLRDIKAALETRLAAIADPLPTQWENAPLDVPHSGMYQRVSLLPAPPENPTFGGGTPEFYREIGILQVTLFYPINGGAGDALDMAEAIRDWFPRGSTYASGSTTVVIRRTPSIGPRVPDPSYYVLPISISYFANVQQE